VGGTGSGGWNRTGRSTTGTALRLDVNVVRRRGCLMSGWSGLWAWTWSTGEHSSIGIEARDNGVMLRFTVRTNGGEPERIVQNVTVLWEPCRFGGEHPFWLCPACGRRITVLYGMRRFACRACNRLTYLSQRERGSDRAQRRANKIRQRLGGEHGLGSIPPRPLRMHRRTYERLIDQVLAADAETEDSAMALLIRLEQRLAEPREGRRGFWS
jgi:hypothetical protein